MGNFLYDLRFGVRMLIRRPGLTAAALIALAFGIGANSAVFSLIHGVLLRPLPFGDSDRLIMVQSVRQQDASNTGLASYPDFDDWRNHSQSFEQLAAIESRGLTLTGVGEPVRLDGASVSGTLFPLLGVQPYLGRVFTQEEDKPGSALVVLSYGAWQRRFGASPDVIGQSVTLEGFSRTVIGVLPQNFKFPIAIEKAEVYTPVSFDGLSLQRRGNRYLNVIGRLKQGRSVSEAQSELEAIAGRLASEYPNSNTGRTVLLVPLYEQLIGTIRPALYILWGAVFMVLLIACLNVGHLTMAGIAARNKEIAIRTALGASRWRVVRQLVTESVVLGLVGGIGGLLLASFGVGLLVSLGASNIPRLDEVGVSGTVFVFTLLISVLVSIGFGLIPAMMATKPDLFPSLKEGERTAGQSYGNRNIGSFLVVSEIAIALVLIIGAALLIRSFINLYQVNPGFDPNNVLTMKVILPYAKFKQASTFVQRAMERIQPLPGVEAAGAATQIPLNGEKMGATFSIEGQPIPPKGSEPRAESRAITPDYFRAMRIPLVKGREFNERDTEDSPGVIIINETMARTFWPDEDPLGKRITVNLKLYDNEPNPKEIVGIVGDVRHSSLAEQPTPEMYLPHRQQNWPFMTFAIRTRSSPLSLANSVRNEIMSVDNEQPVSNVQTMEQIVSATVAKPRFYTFLLGTFAGIALILSIVGIYGLLSYSVNLRRHEIGIRMAVGAQRADILRLVLGQGLKLAMIGVVIGVVGALLATRVMSSLLFGVSATDVLTFIAVSVVLSSVALLASYVPARRATSVDPLVAVRHE